MRADTRRVASQLANVSAVADVGGGGSVAAGSAADRPHPRSASSSAPGGGKSADGELGIAQRLGQLRRLALRSDLVISCHKGIVQGNESATEQRDGQNQTGAAPLE